MPDIVEWHGDLVEDRVRRAMARGLVAIGENIAVEAKQLAHVDTGTLRRSIHVAPVNYIGADDQARAAGGEELPNAVVSDVTFDQTKAMLEVGSWVEYACVEEVGRGHRFIGPAVEMVRTRSTQILQQALREEQVGQDR